MVIQREADQAAEIVELTLKEAQDEGAELDERSFLRGAMAAFYAVYSDGRKGLPICPPKWVFAERRGVSILDKAAW